MFSRGAAARDPHQGQPVVTAGRPLGEADAAMILMHGREPALQPSSLPGARVLERMGAHVTKRVHPGMPHAVNEDEIEHVRALMDGLQVESTQDD